MTRAQQVGAICGAILGVAAVVTMILKFTGTTVQPLPARFESHMVAETRWHEVDSTQDVESVNRDSELHGHINRMEQEQNEMRRIAHIEQCMENAFDMLLAQRLVPFRCDSLGIPRRAGDRPPAEIEP